MNVQFKVQQFVYALAECKTSENKREARRKKKEIQKALLDLMEKENRPFIRLNDELFLVKKLNKKKPKLTEDFLAKCYDTFEKTQEKYRGNALAFANYVTFCQNQNSINVLTSVVTHKIPSEKKN